MSKTSTHFALLIGLLAAVPAFAAESVFSCVKQYGGPGRQLIHSVASDRDGNIAIVGSMWGTADFGGGPLTAVGVGDMFVAKFNSRCEHIWSKRFGSEFDDLLIDVRFDAHGDLLLAGDSRGSADFGGGNLVSAGDYDIFVAKLGRDGSHIWSKRFGDANYQRVDQMDVDQNGNVILAGTFRGTLDFGLGPLSGGMYLAKLNPDGEPLFSRAFSTLNDTDAQVLTVAVDQSGNIAMAGTFSGTLSFDINTFTGTGRFGYSIVLGKFAPNGDHLWSRSYPTSQGEVTFGPAGDLYLWTWIPESQSAVFGSSVFTGPGSVLTRMEPEGGHRWTRFFPGVITKASGTRTLAVDSNGAISWVAALEGSTDLGAGSITAKGCCDIVLIFFNSEGRVVCSSIHGDKRPQFIASLVLGPSTDVVVAGSFSGSIDFGGTTLYDSDGSGTTPGPDQTEEDMFLVRLDRAPCLAPVAVPLFGPTGMVLLGLALTTAAFTAVRH